MSKRPQRIKARERRAQQKAFCDGWRYGQDKALREAHRRICALYPDGPLSTVDRERRNGATLAANVVHELIFPPCEQEAL